MSASLVGSEMCIRDRLICIGCSGESGRAWSKRRLGRPETLVGRIAQRPVSYTHLTLPTICSV
eukprot:13637190-Alexandrium_andersonii.AAC.1